MHPPLNRRCTKLPVINSIVGYRRRDVLIVIYIIAIITITSFTIMDTTNTIMMGTTPNNKQHKQSNNVGIMRHINVIEPTSIDVISAIPKGIMNEMNSNSHYVTGCHMGRWYCMILQNNINNQYSIYIWYSYPNQSLKEYKRSTSYLILNHDELLNNTNKTSTTRKPHQQDLTIPIITMTFGENPYHSTSNKTTSTSTTSASTSPPSTAQSSCVFDSNTVYVYAINPITGALLLWKVSWNDLTGGVESEQQQHPYGYKCFVLSNNNTHADNDDDDAMNDKDSDDNDAYITSLDVSWSCPVSSSSSNGNNNIMKKGTPCIVASTSHGYLYWIHQTHIPMSFYIQEIDIYAELYGNNDQSNFISRLLFTPKKKKQKRIHDTNDFDEYIVNVRILDYPSLPSSNDNNANTADNDYYYSFVSMSRSGQMIVWKVQQAQAPTTSSIIISQNRQQQLQQNSTVIQIQSVHQINNNLMMNQHLQLQHNNFQVWNNAVKFIVTNNNTYDIMVSIIVCSLNHDENGNNNSMLHWIQGRMNSHNQDYDILHIQDIDQFVNPINHVSLYGFTISDIDLYTYGAFTFEQQPIDDNDDDDDLLTSVITRNSYQVIMALPFPIEKNIETALVVPTTTNNNVNTAAPITLLKMVELPNQQWLLSNMWSRDVVTNGISTLDRTGLGLRIRCQSSLMSSSASGDNDPNNQVIVKTYTTITDDNGIRQHFVLNRNQNHIYQLINILYACHREAYIRPHQMIQMPPAVTLAIGTIELEDAIIEYSNKSIIGNNDNNSGAYNNTIPMNTSIRDDALSTTSSLKATPSLQQQSFEWNNNNNNNTLEWHITFIQMLQQTGIYRSLSDITKWKLLSIGQVITVRQALLSNHIDDGDVMNHDDDGNNIMDDNDNEPTSSVLSWKRHHLNQLRNGNNNVSECLYRMQSSTISSQDGGSHNEVIGTIWIQWLCIALDSAMTYREDYAVSYYDLLPNQPPKMMMEEKVDHESDDNNKEDNDVSCSNGLPIWTSHPMIQSILYQQIQYWLLQQQSNHHSIYARVEQIESIVQHALQSFCDSYVCMPNDEVIRKQYSECQQMSIDLIRHMKGKGKDNNNGNDQLAFALSQAYHYYNGICQIVLDHERLYDSNIYTLIPLLNQLKYERDIKTNETFCMYLLKWLLERKLIGHIFIYGKECPDILGEFIENDLDNETLKPYHWIYYTTIKNNYNKATESLLESSSHSNNNNMLLSNAKVALDLAKLCNYVVEKQQAVDVEVEENNVDNTISMIKQRHCMIDKKRELVNAQEELFRYNNDNNNTNDNESSLDNVTLLSPSELLDYAMNTLRNMKDVYYGDGNDTNMNAINIGEECVRICFIALAVCTSMESNNMMIDGASYVWYEVITFDMNRWEQWLQQQQQQQQQQNDLVYEEIIQSTIFAGLLQLCNDDDNDNENKVDDDTVGTSSDGINPNVIYNDIIEKQIFQQQLSNRHPSWNVHLQRLLRNVMVTMKSSSSS